MPGTDEDIQHLEFRVETAAKTLAEIHPSRVLDFMENLQWLNHACRELEASRRLRFYNRTKENR